MDTFASPNGGSLGRVDGSGVRPGPAARRPAARGDRARRGAGPPHHRDRGDGRLAAGRGRRRPERTDSSSRRPAPATRIRALLAAAVRAMDAGIPVALATRCPAGRGRDRLRLPGRRRALGARPGRIPVGHLCAVKARVALALGHRRGSGPGRLDGAARRPGGTRLTDAPRDADHRPDRDARRRRPASAGSRRSASATGGSPSPARRWTSRRARTRSPSGSSWSPTRSRSRASPTLTSTSPARHPPARTST